MKSLGVAALLSIGATIVAASPSAMDLRFAEIRKSPPELYQFLLRMPKGGDLHNHVSGAVYAESYIRIAAEDKLCADLSKLLFVAPASNGCGENQIEAARVAADNTLRNKFIDSLSMRNFVPGPESAHDHFFATFGKFGPSKREHHSQMIAEIVQRAAEQNESYLELMAINGNQANVVAASIGTLGDFDEARKKLEAAGLSKVVDAMRARIQESDDRYQERAHGSGRSTDPPYPSFVTIRYIYEVLRESPINVVFAQTLAGFMLASTYPKLVAVNFVQPEDGVISMRDYYLQMQIVGYAHRLYPNVHITLHAGELAPGLVPPDGLRSHIRAAVETAHAERIGHGVDIMHEFDSAKLLDEMKKKHILVEINLTSNDQILGVRGADHPFPVYRKHGVPVALSTDDEGVSRGSLTQEFARAAHDYNLSYSDLKNLARNSIEYSFLPGASYWKDGSFQSPNAVCAVGSESPTCKKFLESSEKARMQLDLEHRFQTFEKSFQ